VDDDTLDDLLARSATAPSPAAVDTAIQLARETATGQRRPSRRLRRRPLLIGAIAAGAVLLSAGGTLTAYQLGIPPFQSVDSGSERIATPVLIEYTNSLGKQVRCQAFTEWEDLTAEQRTTLNALAQDPYWVGYGDRVLAEKGLKDAPVLDQEQAVFDQAAADLSGRADAALKAAGEYPATHHGFAISCAPGGADGQ